MKNQIRHLLTFLFILGFFNQAAQSQTSIEEKKGGYILIKEGKSRVQLHLPEEMKNADSYIIKMNKLTDSESINADILNRSKNLGPLKTPKIN